MVYRQHYRLHIGEFCDISKLNIDKEIRKDLLQTIEEDKSNMDEIESKKEQERVLPMTQENVEKWNKSKRTAKRAMRDNLAIMPIFGLIRKVEKIVTIKNNNNNNNINKNEKGGSRINRIIKVKNKLKLSKRDIQKTSKRIIRRRKITGNSTKKEMILNDMRNVALGLKIKRIRKNLENRMTVMMETVKIKIEKRMERIVI